MPDHTTFGVEVAYAQPNEQCIIAVQVEPGTTVVQAIERARILERFPEIDLASNKVGIFGKLSKLDQPLQPGDRVEIYRPLQVDAKEVRRRRAAKAAADKKAGSGAPAESG